MPVHPTQLRLENDPDFQNLTFAEQIQARVGVMLPILQQDPAFVKLPAQSRKQVLDSIIFNAPKYPDKEFQAVSDMVTTAATSGNPQQKNWALKQMVKMVGSHELSVNSVLFNVVQNKILSPLMTGFWDDDVEKGKILNRQLLAFEAANTDNRAKAAEYFEMFIEQNGERKHVNRLKVGKIMGLIGGQALDLVPMYAIGVGPTAAPKGLGKILSKPILKALAGPANPVKIMALTAGLSATTATAAGFLGTVRENLRDILNESVKDPTFQTMAVNSAKYFKDYFLGDLAFNFVEAAIFPMVKALPGVFKGFGDHRQYTKGLTFDDMMKNIRAEIVGNNMDPVLFAQLPQAQQDAFSTWRNAALTHQKVKAITDVQAFDLVALKNGFTVGHLDSGKIRLSRGVGGGRPKIYQNMEKAMEAMDKHILEISKVDFKKEDVMAHAAASSKATITEIVNAPLTVKQLTSENILTRLAIPYGGRYSQDQLMAFTKNYARALGGSEDDIAKVFVKRAIGNQANRGAYDRFDIFFDGNKIANVPTAHITPGEEIGVVGDITESLKEAFKSRRKIAGLGGRYQENITLQTDLIGSPAWAKNTIETRLDGQLLTQPNGSYNVTTGISSNNPTQVSFQNYQELESFIMRKTINADQLALSLKYTDGYTVKRLEGEALEVLDRKGKVIATGQDMDELLVKNPGLLPQAPSVIGPKLTFIDDGAVELTYQGQVAIGNYADVMKHLDKFRDYTQDKIQLTNKAGGTISLDKINKGYEVFIPEIQYRVTYDSVSEARKFLEGGWQQVNEMEKIALKKGFRIEHDGANFLLHTTDGRAFVAHSNEEVYKILSTVPLPEWAPELTGIGENVIEQMARRPLLEFSEKPFTVSPMLDASERMEGLHSASTLVASFFRTPDVNLVKMVKDGADENLLKFFRQIETTTQFIRAEEARVGKILIDIFRSDTGKMPKKRRRRLIGELLETPEITKKAFIESAGITPGEVNIAKALRELYGTGPESGLFAKFGVSFDIFVNDYLPRMRKFFDMNRKTTWMDGEAFMNDVFGGKAPNQLSAFFKHKRVDELATIAYDTDAFSIAMKYSSIGHKEKFLGPLWKDVDDYMKANLHTMGDEARKVLNIYRSELMGIPTPGEETIKQASIALYKKLGLDPNIIPDLLGAIRTWGYGASLAARLWMPLRNIWQIWSTLAPRVGNEWVSKAVKRVVRDSDGKIFNTLRNRGIIAADLPIYGADASGQIDNWMQKLIRKGLKWYKNSDEFTRAVAYEATGMRFDDALEKFLKGGVSNEDFFRSAGISNIEPDIGNSVVGFLRQGQYNVAKDLLSKHMVEQTMFPYRAGMSMRASRGVVGKMFGMMGHYSTWYRENVGRGLRYGTLIDRGIFATRWVANTTALYLTAQNLGINGASFAPWTPIIFQGGPFYQLGNQMLQATNIAGNYKGRQARAELFGLKTVDGKLVFQPQNSELAKWLVPGSFFFKSLNHSVKLWNQGDQYASFLAALSAPLNYDWLETR